MPRPDMLMYSVLFSILITAFDLCILLSLIYSTSRSKSKIEVNGFMMGRLVIDEWSTAD